MTGTQITKALVKGLSLGVLWPAAAVTVVFWRTQEHLAAVSHESLDVSRLWIDKMDDAVSDTRLRVRRYRNRPIVMPKRSY